jgi:acetylglutamate kinase
MGKAIRRGKKAVSSSCGGGRWIDTALAQVGIPSGESTASASPMANMNIVVSVLAGSSTPSSWRRLMRRAAGRGLTGADAGAPVESGAAQGQWRDRRPGHGRTPIRPRRDRDAVPGRIHPVIACVGASKNGKLFNVNADTLAGSLAARLKAKRLVIAGATPGVLDKKNQTIPKLDQERIEKLVKSGTANAGMVAKLAACQAALKGGAKNVVIVDGRAPGRLVKAVAGEKTTATTKVVN